MSAPKDMNEAMVLVHEMREAGNFTSMYFDVSGYGQCFCEELDNTTPFLGFTLEDAVYKAYQAHVIKKQEDD